HFGRGVRFGNGGGSVWRRQEFAVSVDLGQKFSRIFEGKRFRLPAENFHIPPDGPIANIGEVPLYPSTPLAVAQRFSNSFFDLGEGLAKPGGAFDKSSGVVSKDLVLAPDPFGLLCEGFGRSLGWNFGRNFVGRNFVGRIFVERNFGWNFRRNRQARV